MGLGPCSMIIISNFLTKLNYQDLNVSDNELGDSSMNSIKTMLSSNK